MIFVVPFLLLPWAYYTGRSSLYLQRYMLPMMLGGILSVVPWAVRNCVVLGTLQPLGSHSGIFLGQLYQDSVTRAQGYWTFENDWSAESSVAADIRGIDREKALSLQGAQRAKQWIGRNLGKMPRVIWERLREFVWPSRRPDQKLLTLVMILAFALLRKSEEKTLYCLMLATTVAYTLVIVATTNDYAGRYFYTLFPIAMIALSIILETLVSKLRPKAS